MPADESRVCQAKVSSFGVVSSRGSCGAAEPVQYPGLLRGSGGTSVPVAGLDCDRCCALDRSELSGRSFSPRHERLESSCEDERDDVKEMAEFLRRLEDDFCVSMAAGGFLLRRLAALISSALFCFLSWSFLARSHRFFSFFFLFAPNSDQLGERHISKSRLGSSSTTVAAVEFLDSDRFRFGRFVSAESIGVV